ncbi:hypothetical protein FRB94_001778 [Tulasnella sp. JGI-2019a]|nr:hypothetical protein FRB93_003803 [Tulasnella sp. JGI-2019a]KAG9005161.1 hypothetical protein FRB94_001778 [Tulasnella sp. JGI-2019a]KAG9026841.1 hypothetical protein FRB95_008390 [Tulasnella sp. JGI-2019a]
MPRENDVIYKTPSKSRSELRLTISPYFARQSTSSSASPTSTVCSSQVGSPTSNRKRGRNALKGAIPSPSKKVKRSEVTVDAECVCRTLHDHIANAKPRLIQGRVADDSWKLIITAILLNQTTGKAAVPVFWRILEKFPTPRALSEAAVPDLTALIACLGLQNVRASRLIQLSAMYCMDPPNQTECRPSRVPAIVQLSALPASELTDLDAREPSSTTVKVKYPPTAISHLPGVGRYALDSYRIFSPDLPGGGAPRDEHVRCKTLCSLVPNREHSERYFEVVGPILPIPSISDPEAEWRKVLPVDKELRKYLIWRWAIENIEWDPLWGVIGAATPVYLWTLSHSFNTQ